METRPVVYQRVPKKVPSGVPLSVVPRLRVCLLIHSPLLVSFITQQVRLALFSSIIHLYSRPSSTAATDKSAEPFRCSTREMVQIKVRLSCDVPCNGYHLVIPLWYKDRWHETQ